MSGLASETTARKDVHLYVTVRLKIAGVAGTDQECIEKARKSVDLHRLFHRELATEAALQPDACRLIYTAYAEDITDYLVDHLNENGELIRDVAYDGNGNARDPATCTDVASTKDEEGKHAT